MYDATSQERLSLALTTRGTPLIALQDGNGTTRASAYLPPGGQTCFSLADANGVERLELSLPAEPEDGPRMSFRDHTGALVLDLDAESLFVADQQNVFTVDKQGKRMPLLNTSPNKKKG